MNDEYVLNARKLREIIIRGESYISYDELIKLVDSLELINYTFSSQSLMVFFEGCKITFSKTEDRYLIEGRKSKHVVYTKLRLSLMRVRRKKAEMILSNARNTLINIIKDKHTNINGGVFENLLLEARVTYNKTKSDCFEFELNGERIIFSPVFSLNDSKTSMIPAGYLLHSVVKTKGKE